MTPARHAFAASSAVALAFACGGSDPEPTPAPDAGTVDGRPAENTGQSCNAPRDCYRELDGATVRGEVQCLDRVSGGYCTHLCETDSDCCAVPGECRSGFRQVCAPFESTGQKMCFLSCEEADLRPAPDGGVLDDTGYCATYGAPAFRAVARPAAAARTARSVCPDHRASRTSR